MLKLLRSLTVVSILVAVSAPNAAKSQEPNYACYMTTSLYQVVDLSNSLCRPAAPTVKSVASVDSLFLAAYKRAAIAKNPNLRDTLLKQPPDINIKYARSICHGFKAGLSAEQVQTLQQAGQINKLQPELNQPVVDLSTIQLLAPQYYCPQFK